MSENRTSTSAMDTDTPPKFWCHQCRAEIKPTLPEFACPACGNDFIEEIEELEHPTNFRLINDPQPPPQPPQQQQPPQFNPPPFPQNPFEMFQQFFLGGQAPFPRPINVNVNVNTFAQPPFMFPMQQFFVHQGQGGENPFDLLQQVFSMGGGMPMGMGGFQHGDYVFDGGFENVLNRLFEMAGRDHRRRPASKEAIASQRLVKITQESVDTKEECSICKDEYHLNEEVMQLGCNHRFHGDCIKRWLDLSSSCPVCRWEIKELPKDGDSTSNDDDDSSQDRMNTDVNSCDSASSFYI